MPATLEKPKQQNKPAWQERRRHCTEDLAPILERGGKVDRAAGIIYGVKVLGVVSNNSARTIGYHDDEIGEAADKNYSYAIEAMHAALPHYEGATVYGGHVELKQNQDGSRTPLLRQRGLLEALGTVKNCRVVESGPIEKQGIWADLHLHKSDLLTSKIMDDVEQKTGVYKLSHEAYVNQPEVVDGRLRLGNIASVDCVALITGKAGTTKSLVESAAMPAMTVKQVLEASATTNQVAKLVLEEMGAAPIMGQEAKIPVGMDAPPEGQPMQAGQLETVTHEALGQVWMAIWNDKTLDPMAKKAKANQLLGFVSKSAAPAMPPVDGMEPGEGMETPSEEASEPADEEAAEEDDFPPKKKKAEEGNMSKPPLDAKIVLECGKLLAAAGHRFSEPIVEAMAALDTAEKRKAFVAELPKAVAESAAPSGPAQQPFPMSQGGTPAPKPVAEAAGDANAVQPLTGEAFAAKCMGRD